MDIPIRLRLLAIPLAAALTACGAEPQARPAALREVATPAGAGSAQPNLSAANGRVYLSWLEPAGDDRHVLRFAVWEGEAWSDAYTIAEGTDYFVNWADFPSLIELPDGRLAAHWLVKSGPASYAYDVHIAQSADGGRTWSAPVTPHRDGTETEHGFASLFPWADGHLGAIWLDGRNYAEAEAHDGGGHATGAEMTLRHAVLRPSGEIDAETLLDGRVCDCCQTSVALTARGPVAVYRDRSPDEIRDIAIVRFVDGRWTTPRPVHEDGWRIPGCPVNGPAVAADGERVAVAWYTMAADTPRVRVAFSDDAGVRFGAPLRVDGGDPVGRVDVLLLDDGSAVVSWLERVGEDAEIRIRRVARDGQLGPARVISPTSPARSSGFPRMARAGDVLLLAWTDPAEPSRVRSAVARLPEAGEARGG